MLGLIISLPLFFFFTATAFAQQASDPAGNLADESMRDISIVGGCTLGGAILGLSTLSFVESPGRHLKNIMVGGALGVIVGVGIVAYLQANKSRDIYLEEGAPAGASLLKEDYEGPVANAVEYYEKKSGGKKTPFVTFSYTF